MGLFGKIIGGTIGFAMAGPLGAIAGAALGHAFDTGVFHARKACQGGRSGIKRRNQCR